MRGKKIWLIAGAFCHLLLCCSLASAQETGAPDAPEADDSSPAAPAEAPPAAVEESLPKVFYLPDKEGNLQAVLDFPFEEFERAYRWLHGLAAGPQRPAYVLQQLSAAGTARADHAELTIQLKVLVRDDDWVPVPLRFDQAVLREAAEYRGPGDHFQVFDEQREGYVSWIRGQAGDQHELTMKVLVPLARVGEATRLRLLAPRATTSALRLTVPEAGVVGRVSEGATLEPPRSAAGGTEFTVRGLGGEFQLTWHKPESPVAEVPPVLEAVGDVLIRIDNRSVETEAALSVRSFGGPFDRFRVRLPPEAELRPGNSNDYSVSLDADASGEDWVEVQLKRGKTKGPVELRLATTRLYSQVKPEEPLELAGFEVAGAARQSGSIAVAAASELQLLWNPSRGVRRADQLPDAFRYADVVAGFHYFAQPYSLSVRLETRKTRINVEPEHLLLVDADLVRLETKLKCRVRGAKAHELYVALAGWEFDEVQPANLVAVERVDVNQAGVLCIPLAQPSTGQIELVVRAHRPIEEDNKSLAVALPQPEDHSPIPATITVSPAAVIVAPADNVALTPDNESMVGLTRQEVAPQLALDRQQAPLFYRGEAAGAVVAFDYRVHPQSIRVEAATELNVEPRTCTVSQKFSYLIAYEPAHHFIIELPRRLAESRQLEFRHEGKAVTPTDLPGSGAGGDSSGQVRKQIDLPEACIGPCELTVRFTLPFGELAPGRPTPLVVPLVMPGSGELTGNRLRVATLPRVKVAAPGGPWSVAEPGTGGPEPRRELHLTAEGPAAEVELTLEMVEGGGEGTALVERAWVQTWLTHSVRQDRAVFSLITERKTLKPLIPAGAAVGQLELRVDGTRIADYAVEGLVEGRWRELGRSTDFDREAFRSSQGPQVERVRLNIPLPADTASHKHILEIRSHFPHRRPRRGPLSIELPQAGGNVWSRRTYWQLVLPQDEHVVSTPEGFNDEFHWGWVKYFWGRKPLLDQAELEAWVGAAPRAAPPERTNRYLFSTFGRVSRCELRTASRSWIVLGASGAALVGGLLLIYLPRTRHPASLLVAGMVLLSIGLLYPEPALLVSQAASLGLGLALVAGLLERSVARRRRETPSPEAPVSILEEGSTETQYRPPLPDNQLSAQSSPDVSPTPHPESDG